MTPDSNLLGFNLTKFDQWRASIWLGWIVFSLVRVIFVSLDVVFMDMFLWIIVFFLQKSFLTSPLANFSLYLWLLLDKTEFKAFSQKYM